MTWISGGSRAGGTIWESLLAEVSSNLSTCVKTSIWLDRDELRAFADEGTDMHRLCTYGDGWVERYGGDVLISYQNETAKTRLTTEFFIWALDCNFKLGRLFGRYLPKRNDEREPPVLLMGDANTNLQTIATECSLRYGIDFSAGYSVGFFIDQRANRKLVRRSAPKKLLNCFAYTCSFSVVAASAGGATVNIDLSKRSLARGRENFALNSLPTNDHRFFVDDVFEVLPRLARRGEKFDIIILDPPTFSRSWRGNTFQVERDFEPLLTMAFELAEPETRILLSTNCASLNERALEVMARFCLKSSRRAGSLHREPPLTDFPPRTGAASMWLTMR
jgi:23S rRNA (cytosine1962-C5)-methyltransferase